MTLTCRVLKLCRAQYYRWLAQPVTTQEAQRDRRVAALQAAHDDDPQAGYRYLREEAEAAGVIMCERTAWKLCSQHGLWSSYGTKRSRNGKRPGPPVHDDLVAHVDAHRWLAMISLLLPARPTRCGSPILANIRPRKESFISVLSKTCFPTGLSVTRLRLIWAQR